MPKILNNARERMLQEAEKLLRQGGYSAVTIRGIAGACGVGVGTVYNYFPSKEALLAEYLLQDWRGCIDAIEAVQGNSPEAVAGCVYRELLAFSQRHADIFRDEAAQAAFAGRSGRYHSLLRGQLAAPLRRFCDSDFAAEFIAEALLTWTVAGKRFSAIWGMICPLFNPTFHQRSEKNVQF